MRVSNWLRPLAAGLTASLAPNRIRPTPTRRPAFRPRVQVLEDRTVPSLTQVSAIGPDFYAAPGLTTAGS